ncbi:MAG TPA: hypothetical protein VLZ05_15690 [Mycobacterium sp.]|nr:hypothetical protein [Mycobacterium sp.]HUH70163.1 hypothetical protein [Mycobacterium sp.]
MTLDIDRSPFFTSDRIGLRSTLRVGFGRPACMGHLTSPVKPDGCD